MILSLFVKNDRNRQTTGKLSHWTGKWYFRNLYTTLEHHSGA